MVMNQLDLYNTFWQPSLYVLNAAERNGITLDPDVCERGATQADKDATALEPTLNRWAEYFTAQVGDFSWRSTTKVPEFLYDFKNFPIPPVEGTLKTIKKNWDWEVKAPKRTTSEAGLTWLIQNLDNLQDRECLKALLKWKKARKYEGDLRKLPGFRDDRGRVHTVIGPDTDTGRLSSKNPNLQQIPANDPYGIRAAFTASEGHVLVVADYSQLELYLLAHHIKRHFGDTALEDALLSGDVHSSIAKMCWPQFAPIEGTLKGCGNPKAEKARDNVKSIIYGVNYGKGDAGLGLAIQDEQGNPIGTEAAKQIREDIFGTFSGITRMQESFKRYARVHGGVHTLLGRWRPIPEALGDDRGGFGGRKALNTPIQGGAADIVTAAMLKTNTYDIPELSMYYNKPLADTGAKLLLQIHDELIFEVPEANAEEACALIVQGMEHPLREGFLAVPLKVAASINRTWGEGH